MSEERALAYLFTDRQDAQAVRTARLLQARGLHPRFTVFADATDITLPPGEVPRLRALQRAEPETFGGC